MSYYLFVQLLWEKITYISTELGRLHLVFKFAETCIQNSIPQLVSHTVWPEVKPSRRQGKECLGLVFLSRMCKQRCFDTGALRLQRAHSYVSIFDSHDGQRRCFSMGEKWQHLGTVLLPVREKKKILHVQIFLVFLALHE